MLHSLGKPYLGNKSIYSNHIELSINIVKITKRNNYVCEIHL